MAGPSVPVDVDSYLRGLERFGVKLGLENISHICEALGHPERTYPSIIVAGTNGKGSVAAMVAAALEFAGHRTGRYTSPHLQRLEERFVVHGHPVSSAILWDALRTVRATVDELLTNGRLDGHPTFFEVTTAAAFLVFQRQAVQIAVLEVGLGGRFDATNVVTPIAAGITSIDVDHRAQLGSTVREIAFEKAGVVKTGTITVVSDTTPDVAETLRTVCQERGAKFVAAADEIVTHMRLIDGRTELALSTTRHRYGTIRLALRGRHQVDNAVLAVRLLEELGDVGVIVPPDAIRAALSHTRWPGRLDLLPAAQGRQVLLDGAHNPAAAVALASYLGEVHPQGLPIVFGAMRDKDIDGMLKALAPHATRFVFTAVAHDRAVAPERLADRAREMVATPVDVESDVEAALAQSLSYHTIVCVTGSIYLVGAVIGTLRATNVGTDA